MTRKCGHDRRCDLTLTTCLQVDLRPCFVAQFEAIDFRIILQYARAVCLWNAAPCSADVHTDAERFVLLALHHKQYP